ASPFKFNQSVLLALNKQGNDLNKNEFNLLQELGKLSGLPIPINLSNLENKKIIHNLIYEKTDAKKSLLDILNIRQ
ncbi:MAG: threonine synthase, partial [Atribacterota bacterium]|nr:threonine synthase [Atribacterota bacterium]